MAEHGLRTFYGDNAAVQPGTLGDALLHETAVAWVRRRETATQPKRPWMESVGDYGGRLRRICQHINDKYEVDNLCREFPMRLKAFLDSDGDRLAK